MPPAASRAVSPARASWRSALSSSIPSAVAKAGRIGFRACGIKAQRLVIEAVALQLNVEAARKDVAERPQRRRRGIALALAQQPADRALGAAGKADQPLRGRGQIGQCDRRLGPGFAVEK